MLGGAQQAPPGPRLLPGPPAEAAPGAAATPLTLGIRETASLQPRHLRLCSRGTRVCMSLTQSLARPADVDTRALGTEGRDYTLAETPPGSLPEKGAGAGGCGQGAPATAVPCGSHHPAGQRGPSRVVLSSEGPGSSSAGQMWGQTWRGGSSSSSPGWCFQEASIQPSPQPASPARASRTFLATRIAAVSHPPRPPVTVQSSNSPIAGV